MIAGIELILIPLSGILLHGQVKLVIYIGIGGVFGVLIGILLITCGFLLWLTPVHRTFYAIAGIVLALTSFITSNLGGFFLGLLLGITGGSLAYAWTPGSAGQAPSTAQDGDTAILPAADQADEFTEPGPRLGGRHRGGKLLASAALPLALMVPLAGGPGPSAAERHLATSGDPGLVASTSASVITAGSATLNGLAYQGAAKVPVAGGGTQTMMKFTLTSLTLSGNVTATVTENGAQTVTQGTTLAFTGGVTLYATRLSGSLLGVQITLTPNSAVSVLLQLLNTLTPLVPLTMTGVTTDQPLVLAGSLQVDGLSLTTS
jgi:hypothetical protein